MWRIALGIEYDGSDFQGWQVQSTGRNVQHTVETALAGIAGHPVRIVCAGRTDSGVHACAQVAHFDTASKRPDRAWVLGTNTLLPDDVNITWARRVADDFHARFGAIERSYCYLILNRPVRSALQRTRLSWVYRPLDEARMQAAARQLVGEHDFSSYRAAACQAKSARRDLRRLDISRHGEIVRIDVSANAFLHHMVRNLAGTLISIGGGDEEPEWAGEVLRLRDRRCAGVTAPPEGLYLTQVRYPSHFGVPQAACSPLPADNPPAQDPRD